MTPHPLLFAQHLARDRRRSPHTVRAYQASAERLEAFLERHWGASVSPEALARIGVADLRAFLAHRRGEGLNNASASRELSAVRAYLAWAVGEGAAPRLRGPRVKRGVPRPIAPDEVMALVTVATEADGLPCRYSAATPATCGLAMLVPLMVLVAVVDEYHDEVMLLPGANTSTQLP